MEKTEMKDLVEMQSVGSVEQQLTLHQLLQTWEHSEFQAEYVL
jgi:hypothetical protein